MIDIQIFHDQIIPMQDIRGGEVLGSDGNIRLLLGKSAEDSRVVWLYGKAADAFRALIAERNRPVIISRTVGS